MKHIAVCVVAMLLLFPGFFVVNGAAASSLEQIVSARQSVRSFTSENISSEQLLSVLRDAYGFASVNGSASQIGSDYCLTVFAVNATGSYEYIRGNSSLVGYSLSVNKETVRSHDEGWPSDASVVLVVVWNQTAMSNEYFASAEAGLLVQNVYLSAVSLNLGTCCVGGVDSAGLSADLQLPSAMVPLLTMPLGYPLSPYPPASPNFGLMNGNLPSVQYSASSFEDALANMTLAQKWSAENLPLVELSQLLWAAYGYANVTSGSSYHRTTPSSFDVYPLIIFVSNATGVYQYSPGNHSVSEVMRGDKRSEIANTTAGQAWVADAPAVFLVVYDSPYNGGSTGDGGAVSHEFVEVDAGTVVQQILLEASARNLTANIVSNGLEDWNGTGAGQLRSVLGLSSALIPLYVIPVGFPNVVVTEFSPLMITPLLMLATLLVVAASRRKRPSAGPVCA
jgi:nitroreductase